MISMTVTPNKFDTNTETVAIVDNNEKTTIGTVTQLKRGGWFAESAAGEYIEWNVHTRKEAITWLLNVNAK